jgi:hypothetical protein
MSILSSQIPAAKFLLGRRGFFFDPEDRNPGGGAPSQGNQPGQNQNGNQNGVPPQQNGVPDPFADIDLDLLDPAVRDKIIEAKTQFAQVANQASQARSFQSRYDQTQAELARVQQQISRGELAPRQSQQQGQQQQPPTFVGELEQYYIEQGIEPAQAKSFAKLNAGAMERFGNRFQSQIQQSMAPLAQQVVNSNAASVFDEVMQSDRLGIQDIPEVAQALWERTQAMAADGQLVNRDVAQNLARIFWARHVEEHGTGNTPTQPANPLPIIVNNPAPNNPPPGNQQTRFTYPGAGAHSRPLAQQQQRNLPMDPDTDAAMAATVSNWQVKPKAYKNR